MLRFEAPFPSLEFLAAGGITPRVTTRGHTVPTLALCPSHGPLCSGSGICSRSHPYTGPIKARASSGTSLGSHRTFRLPSEPSSGPCAPGPANCPALSRAPSLPPSPPSSSPPRGVSFLFLRGPSPLQQPAFLEKKKSEEEI